MRRHSLPLLLIVAGLGLILVYLIGLVLNSPLDARDATAVMVDADPLANGTPATSGGPIAPTLTPLPTPTSAPVLPTRTAVPQQVGSTAPAATRNSLLIEPESSVEPCPPADCPARVGVTGEDYVLVAASKAGLPFGKYLTWWIDPNPPRPANAEFWQLVTVLQEGPLASWQEIGEAVDAQSGSIWVIGNEPDVVWQDNVTPERYAELYHEIYTFIRERDPSATIAIGAVSQPTPLRLAYLDRVLNTYQTTYGQPMPVDIWTVHGFILREEADSWGVGIPPGMEQNTGQLYEIGDHADLEIFKQNLIDFRAWMAQRGYADRPLAVTEFGILHPADYGFPPEVVADFMIGAFDFFLSAANETGYAADNERLVQSWFWYSVYDGNDFPTGNLFDPASGHLTPLGDVFARYARGEIEAGQ